MTETLMLFSSDQVSRLTGLSKRRLSYWADTDFYKAEHGENAVRRPFGRVYSFLDLVALRTIALLANQYQVHLSELRRVAAELSDRRGDWAGHTFFVRGRRVYWVTPGTVDTESAYGVHPPPQAEMRIEMDQVTRDMEATVSKVRERDAQDVGRIVRNRHVAQNAFVLAGTRIPTKAIWAFHIDGYGTDAIREQYPRLTAQDVQAAIEFERPRHAAAG